MDEQRFENGDVVVEEHNIQYHTEADVVNAEEETGNEEEQATAEEHFEDPGTPLENEFPEDEDSEDEDDFKIIIDDTRTNVAFRAPPGGQRGGASGKQAQKLDIDATATLNGQPIFDIDLASLEDKPWRKPGSDVTDYFNYGFTEETWQMYCERQRKLRVEFGAVAANRHFFSNINFGGISTVPSLVNERPIPKINTIQPIQTTASAITNLAAPTPGPTMQPPAQQQQPQLIMRTVLTVPTTPSNTQQQPAPSAAMSTPQPVPTLGSNISHMQHATPVIQSPVVQHIPTVQSSGMHPPSSSPPDSPESTPPPGSGGHLQTPANGDNGPPGTNTSGSGGGPSNDNVPFPDLSHPPPRFPLPHANMNMPPPNFGGPGIPGIPGMPPSGIMNVPPPIFGHPMPPGVPMRFPPPFGFPPPQRPRMPPMRPNFRPQQYGGFEQIPRDEQRSPASYSDKSSDDDERGRYERHRRSRGTEHYRRSSRSPSSSHRSSRDYGSGRERSHRSRHRSRSPVDRSYHGSSRDEREYHEERKESSSSRDKRRKSEEEDSHKKPKKKKIKEETADEDEYEQQRSREKSKKSRDKSGDEKDRSSSGKKRKRSKERHDDDQRDDELLRS